MNGIGHGRGFYGVGQLARQPPKRSNRVWWTVAAVGIGATALWWVWPRAQPGHIGHSGIAGTAVDTGASAEIEALARSRGFSSAKTFEDALVGSAKELEASGATVILGPHIRHLRMRLNS